MPRRAILWQYDTVREFAGVNHVTGPGGAIAGHGGAVVAHGMRYVQSGYSSWFGIPGPGPPGVRAVKTRARQTIAFLYFPVSAPAGPPNRAT